MRLSLASWRRTSRPHRPTQARRDFGSGARAALPLFVPLLVAGTTFGALARPVMGPVAPVLMSTVVFAGSAQFTAVGILATGGGAATATAAGLLVNGRFLAMGAAVTPALSGGWLSRALQGQAVVDASFAIAGDGAGRFNRHRLFGATAVQAVGWVGGTALGATMGSSLPDPKVLGLDVLFPAFYLALLWPELRGRRSVVAAVAGGTTALVLIPVAPAGIPVLVAALPAIVVGCWSR
ncbi:MAG: AzlC family ABC transporter permease [Nocardioidaceae bacterium]